MWRIATLRLSSTKWKLRRLSTAVRDRIDDEGDWAYSSEWWGMESDGHTVLRSVSENGNGVVSVLAYPTSRPNEVYWPEMEKWLQQRYVEIHPDCGPKELLKILGYQWRVLRFNDDTRQSAAKVMAAYQESEPGSVYLMQQAHCGCSIIRPKTIEREDMYQLFRRELLRFDLKSMVSTGLAAIASCNYDVMNAVHGKDTMQVLCIGQGGGSLPLFLASKLQGAIVDVVEIDPIVISASVQAMGFPSFSVMNPSGERASSKADTISEVLWKGIHERLFLHEADAERFVLNTNKVYDMIFIDAYDGEDIFPHKLWDPHALFLKTLGSCLHTDHGTVVVNLHSDSDILNPDESVYPILPIGKYVHKVCRAYKDLLVGGNVGSGLAFYVSVPWVCNSSLVVSRY